MRTAYCFLAALVVAGATPLLTMPMALSAGVTVAFDTVAEPGTIVVVTKERRLYLVLNRGQALRYTVGVGRVGRQWTGTSSVVGKHIRPSWSPPSAVRLDRPNLPDVIPGGSPENPMGVAALTLSGGEYAIHGTNAPHSIGGFVSYGCIRMHNRDITDLFDRVRVGTPVVVLP